MGNYKFSLSNMMPNSWFYKLKGMNRTRKHHHHHQSFHSPKKKQSSDASASRKLHGYHHRYTETALTDGFWGSPVNRKSFNTPSPDALPRKSSSIKKRTKRKTIYKPSHKPKLLSRAKTDNSCPVNQEASHVSVSDVRISSGLLSSESDGGVGGFASPPNSLDGYEPASWSRSCDIIIDMKNDRHKKKYKEVNKGFDSISEVYAFPALEETSEIIEKIWLNEKFFKRTKPPTEITQVEDLKRSGQKPISVGRKSNANSAGIRLRVNSPKISRNRKKASARKSGSSSSPRTSLGSKNKGISDSFAIVMTSVDPQKDFRESMKEMIVENKIKESKDLEDLLACFLSLNSSEYHEIIIKAFEQTWFDLSTFLL